MSRKLSLFVPSMRGGGAERAMANLANGFIARGHGVELLLAQAEGPNLAWLDPAVTVVDLGLGRVAAAVVPLRRHLRQRRPDALIASWEHANVAAMLASLTARSPVPIVLNEQNTLSQSANEPGRRNGTLLTAMARRLYPRAAGLTAVSAGVADDLAQVVGLDRSRVEVVFNPVISAQLEQLAAQPEPHPWFASGEPPVIVAAGRLRTQKDYPLLITAFARARKRSECRLMIFGDGPEEAALGRLVDELGLVEHVALAGYSANPYPAMRRAAVYAMSSRFEGLPTVLIEALFCGAPVVSTDCPSGPREILAGGRFGRLVPVGDVEALTDALVAGVDGRIDPPPVASWEPYRAERAVDRYLELLEGVSWTA